ncbi:hypothetical protein FB451DRAFT_1188454 [Mycena latifolia]|nr:hypothetical protein FB451DRAFT_1188454 [Mycena latifolia]
MALATLVRSIDAGRDEAGRSAFLRQDAQDALDRAGRYAMSAEYHPDRLARALAFLDEVLGALGLTAADARTPDVCRYVRSRWGARQGIWIRLARACCRATPRGTRARVATSWRVECMALGRADSGMPVAYLCRENVSKCVFFFLARKEVLANGRTACSAQMIIAKMLRSLQGLAGPVVQSQADSSSNWIRSLLDPYPLYPLIHAEILHSFPSYLTTELVSQWFATRISRLLLLTGIPLFTYLEGRHSVAALRRVAWAVSRAIESAGTYGVHANSRAHVAPLPCAIESPGAFMPGLTVPPRAIASRVLGTGFIRAHVDLLWIRGWNYNTTLKERRECQTN